MVRPAAEKERGRLRLRGPGEADRSRLDGDKSECGVRPEYPN